MNGNGVVLIVNDVRWIAVWVYSLLFGVQRATV